METTQQPDHSESKTAPPPFNKPDADLIIRSSDSVDFHVRKSILEEVSPIFKDMMTVPQPPRLPFASSTPQALDDAPIVVLPEDSSTLSNLLQFCYPVVAPTIGIENMLRVRNAADKYMMDGPLAMVERELASLVESDPYRVYMIASLCRLEDVTRKAAKQTLGEPLPNFLDFPEIDMISAGVILRLDKYRKAHVAAAQEVLREPLQGFTGTTQYGCHSCPPLTGSRPSGDGGTTGDGDITSHYNNALSRVLFDTSSKSKGNKGTQSNPRASVWFSNYIRALQEALMQKPCVYVVTGVKMDDVYLNAGACSVCRFTAKSAIATFQKELVVKISNKFSSIQLDIVS